MSWRSRFWWIEAKQVALDEARFHLMMMMHANELLFSILVFVFDVVGSLSELLPTYL